MDPITFITAMFSPNAEKNYFMYIFLINITLIAAELKNQLYSINSRKSFTKFMWITGIVNLICILCIMMNTKYENILKGFYTKFNNPYILGITIFGSFIISIVIVRIGLTFKYKYSPKRLDKYYIRLTKRAVDYISKNPKKTWKLKILGGNMTFLGFVPENESSDKCSEKNCPYKQQIFKKKIEVLKNKFNNLFLEKDKKDKCNNCYIKNKQYKQIKKLSEIGKNGKIEILCAKTNNDHNNGTYARLKLLLALNKDTTIKYYPPEFFNEQNVRGRIIIVNNEETICWNYKRIGMENYYSNPIECKKDEGIAKMFNSYWDAFWKLGKEYPLQGVNHVITPKSTHSKRRPKDGRKKRN